MIYMLTIRNEELSVTFVIVFVLDYEWTEGASVSLVIVYDLEKMIVALTLKTVQFFKISLD